MNRYVQNLLEPFGGELIMSTQSILQITLLALLITGISIFALAPTLAAKPDQVTDRNYVRAESDFQIKGYIEKLDCFGKFTHSRKPYDVDIGRRFLPVGYLETV